MHNSEFIILSYGIIRFGISYREITLKMKNSLQTNT